MKPRVIRIFQDADLRGNHKSLSMLASENGIETNGVNPGEFVVFINRKKTMVKVFTGHNTIAFHKNPDEHRLAPECLRFIPEAFGADGSLEMSKAIKKALETAGFSV